MEIYKGHSKCWNFINIGSLLRAFVISSICTFNYIYMSMMLVYYFRLGSIRSFSFYFAYDFDGNNFLFNQTCSFTFKSSKLLNYASINFIFIIFLKIIIEYSINIVYILVTSFRSGKYLLPSTLFISLALSILSLKNALFIPLFFISRQSEININLWKSLKYFKHL